MSSPAHRRSLAQPPGDLEDKNLPYRKIVGVGVAAVVIFGAVHPLVDDAFSTARKRRCSRPGPPPLPPGVNQYEVGIVNQRMFSLDQRAAQKRLQQMNRLNSYGWIDRQAGVVHIPVDVAMDMLVKEQTK